MLISIAVIMFTGLFLGWICQKVRIPSLLGMIFGGIIIGPYVMDLIDSSVMDSSSELRKMALIIILIRAGLKLSADDLKKVGRPAILMCFLPALFEIIGMVLLAPKLLGMSNLDSLILGAVVGAVSPAVIVPRMIKLIDEEYGTKKGIPQMILAGASVDDVFVIVMFTTFTGLAKGEKISWVSFINIPLSVIIGILIGLLAGFVLTVGFTKIKMRDTVKVIVILCSSFVLVTAEDVFGKIIPFASLIGVMALGLEIKKKKTVLAKEMSQSFDRLWVFAEALLFVLLGASVNIESAKEIGISGVILVAAVLLFRMTGVLLCLVGTKFSLKERIFAILAYIPKATVQAAIGGLPLEMGLECGNTVLTVSVIAILLTAPLGAFAIDLTYKRLLNCDIES